MEQNYFRVVISYNGNNYFGWQDLGEEPSRPTIQGTITQALKKISKYGDCAVAGASRTDAGVHSQGQVARLSTPVEISAQKLQLGLNSLLPKDIRILSCVSCSVDFNPNQHSSSKRYRYYFSTDRIGSPILDGIVAHVPMVLEANENTDLDLERMKQACSMFIGEYDFYSFATRDKNIGSTVRSISHFLLKETRALNLDSRVYYFEIEGSGFLRHMIRYMVGALIEIGRHRLEFEDMREALENRIEVKLSSKAKAHGLHLVEILY